MTPQIKSVTKVGPTYWDPEYRISFERCSFCEQTSLDGKQDIDHHPDCPNYGHN